MTLDYDYKKVKQFQDMALLHLMHRGRVSEHIEDLELKVRIAGLIALQLSYVKDLQDEVQQLKTELAIKDSRLAKIQQICEKGDEDDA